MTTEIPISFEYEGILFEGYLVRPFGAGVNYRLTLYNYNYGQLIHYYNAWKWGPTIENRFAEPYMEQYFVSIVESADRNPV